MAEPPRSEFERIAPDQQRRTFLGEIWLWLRCNKKYWLLPILLVFLLFAALLLLSGTPFAPFIYTFF